MILFSTLSVDEKRSVDLFVEKFAAQRLEANGADSKIFLSAAIFSVSESGSGMRTHDF